MSTKLSRHAFTRFWDVHAWAGVVTSLVVYVMFFLGSVVLFYRPLTVWEEPLMQRPTPVIESLQATLELAEPLPEEFYLYLPKDQQGLAKVGYFLPGTTKWRMWWLDDEQHRAIPQREMAAAYVYDLHYLWHDVTGYWLQYGAGVLVFGFLLALVTGVLIHLKNFAKQLHQFRPAEDRRVFWSDMHKVVGVLGLPFQLVYALTGSLMVLSPLLFQLSIGPVFGGDELRAVETAGALVEEPPPRDYGKLATPLSLDTLASRARAVQPNLVPESFVFRGYRHERGTVDVRGEVHGQPFGDGLVRLKAADGTVERVETPDHERAVGTLARWMHGLHTVHYGGLPVRVLLFVLAIGGCITILTGNWIWLERRRGRAPSVGNTILARLTAGVGAGALVALAALFLASRLLPLDWPGRPKIEEVVLASTFFACVAWALSTSNTAATWWRQLGCAGVVLASVPLAATRHSAAGLFGSGPRIPTVVAVELAFVALSCVLFALALALRRVQLRRRSEARASDASPNAEYDRATDGSDSGPTERLAAGVVHD